MKFDRVTFGKRGDEYERKSLLRCSSRGSKIWRGLWFRPCYRNILHRQPFDTLGNHPRHFGLAVCDLLRTVSVIISVRRGFGPSITRSAMSAHWSRIDAPPRFIIENPAPQGGVFALGLCRV